ncbi:MAG TPA: hypothetical protein VEZ13_18670, partial [Brevibacillus sp.]|nr:hypothetical protein [Brevibacillus sp.]
MSRRPWKRYIALFVIGSLLGGASILFMHGREMEEMMLVKQSLELQNKKLYEENLLLKKNQHVSRRKQETVIEEIRVTVLDRKP